MSLEGIAIFLCVALTIWISIGIRQTRQMRDWGALVLQLKQTFIDSQIPDEVSEIPLHDWSELRDWPSSLQELLKRTTSQLHILEVEDTYFLPIAEVLGCAHHSIPCQAEVLAETVTESSARLVMIAYREGVMSLIKMIHQYPGIRDHLHMVIAVDPIWDREWLEVHFTHEAMDAEASRQISYLSLHHQSTAETEKLFCPKVPPTGWNSISVFNVEDFPNEPTLSEEWCRILSILINRLAC